MLINTFPFSPALLCDIPSPTAVLHPTPSSTRSYLERMEFLQRKVFQCEHTSKGGLDYFAAHASELDDLKKMRQRFPDELKGKVLASAQFR